MSIITHQDQYGFPIEACRRCGGSGSFGPVSVHSGKCFDCGGSGWRVTRKASAARAAFLNDRQAWHHPQASALKVGDRVRIRRGDDLRTIAAIRWEYIGGSQGWSRSGTEENPVLWMTHLAIRIYIIWEGGAMTLIDSPRSIIHSRAGAFSPEPYLQQIGA